MAFGQGGRGCQVRYYPGKGTIHFFARDKKLVDRLNRMVGQHRQWLPPVTDTATEGFWQQYEGAEKFDAEIRKVYDGLRSNTRHGRSLIKDAFSQHDEYSRPAQEHLSQSIATVLASKGIDVGIGVTHQGGETLKIELSAA